MDDTRAAEIRSFAESEYTCISGVVRSYLADLLAEREQLLAVVEAAIAMEDVRTEPGHWSGQRTERQITTTAKFRAAVRAYRTGEDGQ